MTTAEPSELFVRAASLYLPVTIVIALAVHVRPDRRRVAGALLATAWNTAALLAMNLVAAPAGWWHFETDTATVAGVPTDTWMGWALLWGVVPLLATTTRPLAAGALLVAADLVLMPLAGPVVALDDTWLVGEAVAVVVCLVPGLLLGRWTATGDHLAARVVLQVVAFCGLLLFVLPTLVFTIILLAAWGALLGSAVVAAAAAMGATLSAGLAAWNEDGELGDRFGDEWRRYRRHVRLWAPSVRPTVTHPAVVYVARSCEPCSQVGDFLVARQPIGLAVRPAEDCAVGLRRVTYEQAGSRSTGVAAVGQSLEHVNLAWAAASWVGRVPGIQQVLQLVTDAVVGGARAIAVRGPQEAERMETGRGPSTRS
jgi:protein-S-isoprenylcysteine O-methyltransferase Ste14